MANFCTNCGSKLEGYYNYCINCGTKIDKSDNPSSNQYSDSMEKKKAKRELKRVVGGSWVYNTTFINALIENGLDWHKDGKAIRQQVEKEIDSGQIKSAEVEYRVNQLILEYKIKNEEAKKKLKTADEIFESAEIKLEISKNNIGQTQVVSIKNSLKYKIINKRDDMSEEEIKYFIKTELQKAGKEQKKARIAKEREMNRKIEVNKRTNGGYCDLNCRHCYEEFIDGGGSIVGDFDSEGYVDYYCHLGHSISFGSFCEDYE